jgi:glycosyltransferase involved in cell wall biosynthesis
VRAEFVPNPLVPWDDPAPSPPRERFVVGFAGRLVEEKGVHDLIAAVGPLPEADLVIVGDGPLRPEVEAAASRNPRIELLTDVRHARMPSVYERMDVLVLPSRTTPTWTEQFGRVLVEALSLGVPVVGADSGEIPWVVNSTGGGVIFPEGDVAELTRVLRELHARPERRLELGSRGRAAVAETYSMAAVAGQMDRLLSELAQTGH